MTTSLVFIVNGESTLLGCDGDRPLAHGMRHALAATNNTARQLEEWELRTERGILLDRDLGADAHGLVNGEHLFVTLRVGGGG